MTARLAPDKSRLAINRYMRSHGLKPAEAWKLKSLLRMDDPSDFEAQKRRFDEYQRMLKNGLSRKNALALAAEIE